MKVDTLINRMRAVIACEDGEYEKAIRIAESPECDVYENGQLLDAYLISLAMLKKTNKVEGVVSEYEKFAVGWTDADAKRVLGTIYSRLGSRLRKKGKDDIANYYLEKSAKFFDEGKHTIAAIALLNELDSVYLKTNNYAKPCTLLRQRLEKNLSPGLKIYTMLSLSRFLFLSNHRKESENYIRKSMNEFVDHYDKLSELSGSLSFQLVRALGDVLEVQPNAGQFYSEWIFACKQHQIDELELAYLYDRKGKVDCEKGRLNEGIASLTEAIKIICKINVRRRLMQQIADLNFVLLDASHRKAKALIALSRPDEALGVIQFGFNLNEGSPANLQSDYPLRIAMRGIEGKLYGDTGEFDKQAIAFKKAEQLLSEVPVDQGYPNFLAGLGDETKNYAMIERVCRLALSNVSNDSKLHLTQIQKADILCALNQLLGKALIQQGEFSDAIHPLHDASKHLENFKSIDQSRYLENLLLLARAYAGANDHKTARSYLEKHAKLLPEAKLLRTLTDQSIYFQNKLNRSASIFILEDGEERMRKFSKFRPLELSYFCRRFGQLLLDVNPSRAKTKFLEAYNLAKTESATDSRMHLDMCYTCVDLGIFLSKAGDFDDASKYFRLAANSSLLRGSDQTGVYSLDSILKEWLDVSEKRHHTRESAGIKAVREQMAAGTKMHALPSIPED